MENAGAIVYSESLLLIAENAPLTQLRAYGEVHAHELTHQWFGNLDTPKLGFNNKQAPRGDHTVPTCLH